MSAFDNVEVTTQSAQSDFCVSWTRADNARYHVWLDRATRQVRESRYTHSHSKPLLYKNPPYGVERGELRYFPTRRLDASKHQPIIDAVVQHAKEAGLFEAADRAVEAREQEEQRKREATIARKRIEAAAPALCRALRLTSAALQALVRENAVRENREILIHVPSGDEHLTIGKVLDIANEALEPAT